MSVRGPLFILPQCPSNCLGRCEVSFVLEGFGVLEEFDDVVVLAQTDLTNKSSSADPYVFILVSSIEYLPHLRRVFLHQHPDNIRRDIIGDQLMNRFPQKPLEDIQILKLHKLRELERQHDRNLAVLDHVLLPESKEYRAVVLFGCHLVDFYDFEEWLDDHR